MDTERVSLFWDLADEMIAAGKAEEGTMMGSRCLRASEAFFAMVDGSTGHLIVKLPQDRVVDLVDRGVGLTFAPAGRVFREWVAIPQQHEGRWSALMVEGRAFVTGP